VAYLNSEVKPKAHWMVQAKPILQNLPEWAEEVPYQVKKMAVSDAYKAFGNGCAKAKKTKQAFKLKFRSKKDPKQSCFIPSSAIKKDGIYVTKSGKLSMAEAVPENLKDSRLICQNGRWFLAVPYAVEVTKTENKGRMVAIDPGVRTFATLFSEDVATKIGENSITRIHRLCVKLDKLTSKIALSKAKAKRKVKKAMHRLKWKVWDLVDELHYKTIKHLTDNFDTILLPTFETSQMVSKSGRKIRSKTARQMLTLSHFKFKMRLKSKAETLGKTVLDVCEAYTSKTASWTGEMVKIGGSKFIKSQGLTLDRDINGARGIFLRAMVDNPCLTRSQTAMLQAL
jgi:putative transposase